MKRCISLMLFVVILISSYAFSEEVRVFNPCWRCIHCGELNDDLWTNCCNCRKKMESHILYLAILFKENFIFSRYGINVLVDNCKLFHLEHGESIWEKVRVTEGEHTITLQKDDEPSCFVTDTVNLSEDGIYHCRIETKGSGVVVSDVEKEYKDISYEVAFKADTGRYSSSLIVFDMDTNCFTRIIKRSKKSEFKPKEIKEGYFEGSFDEYVTLFYEDGDVEYYNYLDDHLYSSGPYKISWYELKKTSNWVDHRRQRTGNWQIN